MPLYKYSLTMNYCKKLDKISRGDKIIIKIEVKNFCLNFIHRKSRNFKDCFRFGGGKNA